MITLSRTHLLVLTLVAAGCAPGGTTDDPDAASGPPGLTGLLHDEADRPLGGATVLACMATACLFGDTQADGRFLFPIDPPVDVALKTSADPWATPRRAAALYPVQHVSASLVDVGILHVPTLPAGTPIGPAAEDPQTLAAGDGLELTLRRADLTPRLGDILDDVAARSIPAARVPPLPALGSERIVAVYALHPFGATSTSPIAVRAPADLPADTPVRFRTISELDGHLSEPVPGRAIGDAVETDALAGITELTWLVISEP